MMNQAFDYLAKGLSVFPVCSPKDGTQTGCNVDWHIKIIEEKGLHQPGKTPAVKWGEFQKRMATKGEVEDWFMKWPDANLGCATGEASDVGIVDLDGQEGLAMGRKLGLWSPVRTITGKGEQLWYRMPKGFDLRNSVKKFAPGIDVRGNGGYTCMPPSLHASGKRYTWSGQFTAAKNLPEFPKSVIDLILLADRQRLQEEGHPMRKPEGWMAEAIEKMQQGHVANTLVSVLGKFRMHGFDEESTHKFLLPYALVDGQPWDGLRAKIAEIWKRYPSALRQPESSKSEDINDFLDNRIEVEWLCAPYVARRSIGFVVGLPETLKTWLCIDFAVAAAMGGASWAGLFPVTGSKVLFIDQERPREETQRRFNGVIAARGASRQALKGRLTIKCGTTIQLDLEQSFQALRNELLQIRPDIVIIDSLRAFKRCDENSATEMQNFFEKVKQLRTEVGCAFMFIHHENKYAYPHGEPVGEPNAGTIAGSGSITGAAEFCLIVRKADEDTSLVWHAKSTMGRKRRPFYAKVVDVDEGFSVQGFDE